MPPIYTTAELNARLAAVVSAIDAGGSHGFCNILNATNGLLAQLALQGPPCGSVANGVLTFAVPWTAAQAIASGAPVSATITDSNNNVAISGLTVGTAPSGYDIVLSDPTITSGKTVIMQTATITGH